jgi:hypothetical protein
VGGAAGDGNGEHESSGDKGGEGTKRVCVVTSKRGICLASANAEVLVGQEHGGIHGSEQEQSRSSEQQPGHKHGDNRRGQHNSAKSAKSTKPPIVGLFLLKSPLRKFGSVLVKGLLLMWHASRGVSAEVGQPGARQTGARRGARRRKRTNGKDRVDRAMYAHRVDRAMYARAVRSLKLHVLTHDPEGSDNFVHQRTRDSHSRWEVQLAGECA